MTEARQFRGKMQWTLMGNKKGRQKTEFLTHEEPHCAKPTRHCFFAEAAKHHAIL